jgi:hypothetical protein
LKSINIISLVAFLLGMIAVHAGEIAVVTPTGSVKKIQQVRVRFSTDMVPMGDPRSAHDPMVIKCNESAKKNKKVTANEMPAFKTRWIDSKNWSLDYDKPLSSGVHCTLTAAVNLKDLKGQPVTGSPQYDFSTSGPALLNVAPRYGSIEPEQFFVV